VTAVLEQAKCKLAKERDRQTRVLAAIERLPPSPRTPAGGWTGFWPAPAIEPSRPAADMAPVRARLDHEHARIARIQQPRVRPPAGETWRPTPTPGENAAKAANPAAITMQKLWDLSPVDHRSDSAARELARCPDLHRPAGHTRARRT
jgi:hypothetical protein